jgi:hypothetical protein
MTGELSREGESGMNEIEKRLQQIREREQKATPGTWRVVEKNIQKNGQAWTERIIMIVNPWGR